MITAICISFINQVYSTRANSLNYTNRGMLSAMEVHREIKQLHTLEGACAIPDPWSLGGHWNNHILPKALGSIRGMEKRSSIQQSFVSLNKPSKIILRCFQSSYWQSCQLLSIIRKHTQSLGHSLGVLVTEPAKASSDQNHLLDNLVFLIIILHISKQISIWLTVKYFYQVGIQCSHNSFFLPPLQFNKFF